ncbi:MAG: GFA family protein [Aquirhabdus sp.]
MYTGSCLCGGVKFSINAELAPIQICHCSQCRKAQGSAFATNTPVSTSDFELKSGADLLTEYESSPGKRRLFCRQCGSPIYSSRDSLPNVIRIRAGLLDEPLKVKPAFHFYTASKCRGCEVANLLSE